MSRPQEPVSQVGAALPQPADVAHPRRGHHDHPGAAVMDPPAQLGVFAVEVDRGIEAAQLAEQVGAHEQIGGGQHEDVPDTVVLFLVDLAGLDDRVDLAESVHPEPDRLQHARIVPVDATWDRPHPAFDR